MSDEEPADQEPTDGEVGRPDEFKGRRSLSRMRRELTDDELNSLGVAKILSDDVERLEREVTTLRDYERRFHEKDRETAVLQERQKKSNAIEITSSGALTIGALLVGLSPSVWAHQPAGGALLTGGVVVLIMGIIVKVLSR